jgi:glycolate oxidase iron-sulfur subunit
MQTHLAAQYQDTDEGRQAEAILRKCVHCGFCTATCPTYQLLGDELDGPRGRIYLIKQVLEGEQPTRKTQLHLDRCLTCRNCESTCPSGVQYGHLIDIGRKIVDEQVPRPASEKALRWALKEGLPSPLFSPAMKLGQAVRGLLPDSLAGDAWLPDGARTALGLRNNATRLARDSFLLTAMQAVRAETGRLVLMVCRFSAGGEPLKPGRLLFRCAAGVLP